MNFVRKILSLVLLATMLLSLFAMSASAAEADFSWKPYDKGYVSFVIDDVYSETPQYIKLFQKYNMPMCEAVPAYKIVDSEGENPFQVKQWLTEIQNHGGEILAHNYTHTYFTPETPASIVEEQFSKARKVWDASEYNVNGIIACNEAANGNPVKDYTVIGELASKYGYKYSNRYGVGEQYSSINRIWLNQTSLSQAKRTIESAIANKKWVVFAGHNSNDIKINVLEEILKFIDATEGVECVTLKYMFETYGNYSTPQDFGPTYYTVNFTDTSGKVIDSQVVVKGAAAKAPSGYNWDTDVSNITNNLTVKPVVASNEPDNSQPGNSEPNNSQPSISQPNNSQPGNSETNNSSPNNSTPNNTEPNSNNNNTDIDKTDNNEPTAVIQPGKDYTVFIIIGVVSGVLIIAAVVVLIIVLSKKKKA